MNCRQERCRRDLGIKQTRSRTSQTGAQTRTNGRGKGGRGKNSNGRGGCRCAARGAGRQSTTEARRLLAHCAARAALGKAARRSKPGVARGVGGGGTQVAAATAERLMCCTCTVRMESRQVAAATAVGPSARCGWMSGLGRHGRVDPLCSSKRRRGKPCDCGRAA